MIALCVPNTIPKQKNKKLKSDLDEALAKNDNNADTVDLKDFVSKESYQELLDRYNELSRRLGTKEYQQLTYSNLNQVTESMDSETCVFFGEFINEKFNDKEKIKFCLGVASQITPSGKFAFLKTCLAMDSAPVRESVLGCLTKLVENDKISSNFVREVLDNQQSTEEITPKSGTAVEDLSSVGLDVGRYYTKKNEGCRVVKVGQTNILAVSKDTGFTSTHTARCDVYGKSIEQKCYLCSKVFVGEVTLLCPVIIVGPESHGRLGSKTWVCKEHWEQSVMENTDMLCDRALLEHESEEFLLPSPGNAPSKRSKKGLTRVRGVSKLAR